MLLTVKKKRNLKNKQKRTGMANFRHEQFFSILLNTCQPGQLLRCVSKCLPWTLQLTVCACKCILIICIFVFVYLYLFRTISFQREDRFTKIDVTLKKKQGLLEIFVNKNNLCQIGFWRDLQIRGELCASIHSPTELHMLPRGRSEG